MSLQSQRKVDGVVSREDSAHVVLDRIQTALRGLRYGAVTILVHDGEVVMVERTEKLRLEKRERLA
jgi:hypothetical protein